jgi:adenosylhomocysteinase
VALVLDRTAAAAVAAEAFFHKITNCCAPTATQAVLVAHVLPSQPRFVEALQRLATVAAVLPKPKSIDTGTLRGLQATHRCEQLDRLRFAEPGVALDNLEAWTAGQPVVLLDVGGYFAPALDELCARFSGQILGVVEDTENGLRRYERLEKLPCAVYSVARSPLKEAEDSLVGESIVFSTEALLRTTGEVLSGRRACVVGFGKIGASIARTLRARNVHVTVADIDPVRLVRASAMGFAVASTAAAVLPEAELVFSATGNQALSMAELARVRDGAYIVSATSSDDELCLNEAEGLFERELVAPQITRYLRAGRHFNLVNDGNAVNFLHGSAVGPSIHLVQAEILAALAQLAERLHAPGLYEVAASTRAEIADAWLSAFHPPR